MDIDSMQTIKTALDGLRDSQAAVESAFLELAQQDMAKGNNYLRETIEQLNILLRESREETSALHRAHEELISNFKHELMSKRLSMLGMSERQHHEYINAGLERERARINLLYHELHNAIAHVSTQLYQVDAGEREMLQGELQILRERVNWYSAQSRARAEAAYKHESDLQSHEINQLRDSPVEYAALGAVRQFFAWETFWGLKIISVIGAVLLLLGVFTFGRFLYINMGPVLQCLAIFVLGLILLGTGEAFYRKKWQGGFALALTSSGSGVLFLGAALGFMTLGVLPMWAALGICAGVSLITFAASLRYNAQLVAIFALIGGYLPIIALEGPLVFFGAIYFTFLSLLALLISTRKNWRAARFIGLGTGLIAFLVLLLLAGWARHDMTDVIVVMGISIAVSYLTYLVIPIFGAWFTKTHIIKADIVLLSCNVFFSYLLALLWGTDYIPRAVPVWWEHRDMLAAAVTAFFALSCIIMALVAERKEHNGVPESETGSLRALFFITSIAFCALVVLFLFDSVWFSAGWLVQAVGLSLYGIFRNRRRFIRAGLVIGISCLFAFLIVNLGHTAEPLFVWQYLSVTLAAAIVSIAALKLKPQTQGVLVSMEIFRGVAMFNLWIYLIYLLHDPLLPVLQQLFGENATDFAILLSIVLGFAVAFILPRIKYINTYGSLVAAVAAGLNSTLLIVVFNARASGLLNGSTAAVVVIFTLYIVVNIIAVCWVNDLLRFFTRLRKLSDEWYPLLISCFAVILVTQNMVVQLSLRASSLVLTLLFGLTALGWVLFGFIKRNSVTRISGLVLVLIAVAKLFFMDLSGLETTWRIISYFTGGVLLLAISFTYQWFSKRLATAVPADEESDNA